MYPDVLIRHFEEDSKGTLDYAAHNLSRAIYNGLKENGQKVRLINVPNIGSYPILYNKPIIKGTLIEDGESISFCNIPVVKHRNICRKIYQKLKEELTILPKGESVVFLMYNSKSLPIVKSLKNICPNLKTCMVVTDLPEYMVKPNSKLYDISKKIVPIEKRSESIDVSSVDGFVLLAPKMSEKLNVLDKPWIQMEGIFETGIEIKEVSKESGKIILYTGNLSERYGIINLLNAFDGIKGNDFKLWFRGSGDCKEEILKQAEKDNRISLLPPLSREELLELQKKATVLINPVSPSESFTNYFFPSKTLEYLASGTPVVMYHLSCIPKEYDDFIFYLEDDSVEGLKNKIVEVCSKPQEELDTFGKKASDFIYKYKTPKPQMAKVIDFINSII